MEKKKDVEKDKKRRMYVVFVSLPLFSSFSPKFFFWERKKEKKEGKKKTLIHLRRRQQPSVRCRRRHNEVVRLPHVAGVDEPAVPVLVVAEVRHGAGAEQMVPAAKHAAGRVMAKSSVAAAAAAAAADEARAAFAEFAMLAQALARHHDWHR